jgi:hypothetical protein
MKTRDPEAEACVMAAGRSRYHDMLWALAVAAEQAKMIVRKRTKDGIRIFIVFLP